MFEALADLSTAIVLAAALALTAVAPASAATPTVVKCVSVLDANGELMHRSAW